MVFCVIVYEFACDGMVTPCEHSAMRSFFDVALGIKLCRLQMVLCRLCMVRRCLLMIFDCFFKVRFIDGRLAFADGWGRWGCFFFVVHIFHDFICLFF